MNMSRVVRKAETALRRGDLETAEAAAIQAGAIADEARAKASKRQAQLDTVAKRLAESVWKAGGGR